MFFKEWHLCSFFNKVFVQSRDWQYGKEYIYKHELQDFHAFKLIIDHAFNQLDKKFYSV